MLSQMTEFLQKQFKVDFRPKFILSDNSDAIIAGCREALEYEYVHLLCHFHIHKGIREKTQKKELSKFKPVILYGIKALKNSQSMGFFLHVWNLISDYWQEHGVPLTFIECFEKEYVKKEVEWHYASAFPGKSRSNNSVESANNILKDYYNRKAHNIKEFLAKMKGFLQEWSTVEKIAFPTALQYKEIVKKQAEQIIKNNLLLKSTRTPGILYCLRKRIDIEDPAPLLEKFLKRKRLPSNVDELFEGWGIFRTVNTIKDSCDCANSLKFNYCKHRLAVKIVNAE